MLTGLHIEGFLRIPYARIDLTGAAIHAFYGANEQGKSSIAEAVRFVYRGLSRRVRLKGDFDQLITHGKRTGSVEVIENDTPRRRNVKDGAVTTRSGLNFEDLHVDLQLGAEEFGRVEEDELRPLLLQLLQAKADEKMVRERLLARGLTADIIDVVMPLIKKVGFASAADHAKKKRAECTGAWKRITGAAYGHVKAETWRPDVLDNVVLPRDEEIERWKGEVERLTSMQNSYRTALASAKTTLELTGIVSDGTTLEDAEAALKLAQANLADCDEQIAVATKRYADAIEADEQKLRNAEHELINAKNAATQLSCPCCQAALQIVMVEGEPVLERALEDRNGPANVASAVQAVTMARQALAARKNGRESTMAGLNNSRGQAQDAVHHERTTVDNVRKLQNLPKVTAQELENLKEELTLLAEPLETAKTTLDDLQARKQQVLKAQKDEQDAMSEHREAQQWAIVEECCGSTSAGIPAELVGRITKPLNEALANIAQLWGVYTIRVTDDLQVQNEQGEPYYLMSESAQWRANAMIQLALAHLTNLKLVCIDRFDVALERGAFFDMLSQYTQLNPEVTVLAFGSLRNTPPPFPGVKFHHVDNGAVHTIQQSETADAN